MLGHLRHRFQGPASPSDSDAERRSHGTLTARGRQSEVVVIRLDEEGYGIRRIICSQSAYIERLVAAKV